MNEFEVPDNWTWVAREGVRLAIPSDWEEVQDPGVLLAVAGPRVDDEGFRPNVNIVAGPSPAASEGLEDFVAGEFVALSEMLVELQAIDTDLCTINDREWARVLMAFRGATHALTLEQRTTYSGEASRVVSATVDTNEWAAHEQAITTIMDSITFEAEQVR